MIYAISFLVFAAPVFLAFFLTSKLSGTVKIVGTLALILLVIVIPSVLILLQQS